MTGSSGPFVTTTESARGSRKGLDTGNVDARDYEAPEGGVVVRVPAGYEFAPGDNDLPRITPHGVRVTEDQALALVEESSGLVLWDAEDADQDTTDLLVDGKTVATVQDGKTKPVATSGDDKKGSDL